MGSKKSWINSLCIAALVGYVNIVQGAIIPAGIKLADKQQLVKANAAEPASLDPQIVEGVPEGHILRELFEGLIYSGPRGEVLPGLAQSWETTDNMNYIFHLRQNGRWSNGDPVTAHDFEYSFKRIVDPATASPYAWYFELAHLNNAADIIAGKKPVATLGVKATDDFTLEVKLDESIPYFVSMLSHVSTFPVSKKAIAQFGDKWILPGNMISNGAYSLKEWQPNSHIALVRNPYYWDNANTVIDNVTFFPIDPVEATKRYVAGEVDMTYAIPVERFAELKKSYPNEVKVNGYVGTYYYTFNFKRKPFDDIRVRTALSYAIDRTFIADVIMGQGQLPAYGLVPDYVDGFYPAAPMWSMWTQEERNAKARALLEEVGISVKHPLQLVLLYNTDDNNKKVATAITTMWKKLGVEATLVDQEWKTYLANKGQGEFDIARAAWIADYNEASSMLDMMQSSHGYNDGKYFSAQFDQLMEQSRKEVDVDSRNSVYAQAEELLAKDMPVAPIFQYVTARMVKPYVGGYPNNPLDNHYAKDMYIVAH